MAPKKRQKGPPSPPPGGVREATDSLKGSGEVQSSRMPALDSAAPDSAERQVRAAGPVPKVSHAPSSGSEAHQQPPASSLLGSGQPPPLNYPWEGDMPTLPSTMGLQVGGLGSGMGLFPYPNLTSSLSSFQNMYSQSLSNPLLLQSYLNPTLNPALLSLQGMQSAGLMDSSSSLVDPGSSISPGVANFVLQQLQQQQQQQKQMQQQQIRLQQLLGAVQQQQQMQQQVQPPPPAHTTSSQSAPSHSHLTIPQGLKSSESSGSFSTDSPLGLLPHQASYPHKAAPEKDGSDSGDHGGESSSKSQALGQGQVAGRYKSRWTEEEITSLKEGVRKHGEPTSTRQSEHVWETILNEYEFNEGRCARALRDKWRQLKKKAEDDLLGIQQKARRLMQQASGQPSLSEGSSGYIRPSSPSGGRGSTYMMMEDTRALVIGLDLGNTCVRAIVYAVDGDALVPVKRTNPKDSKGDRTPEVVAVGLRRVSKDAKTQTFNATDYLECVVRAIDDVMNVMALPDEDEDQDDAIVVVGISCLAMTLIGVNEGGDCLTPVYTGTDSRGGKFVDSLKFKLAGSTGGLDQAFERTGTPIDSSYAPAMLMYLQTEEHELFESVSTWTTLSAFVLSKLTGVQQPVSLCEASWMGLINSCGLSWDAEMLKILGMEESNFPSLCDMEDLHTSGMVASYAQRWPALKDTLWARGVGDGAALSLGMGCVTKVCVMIGKNAVVSVFVPRGEAGDCKNKCKGECICFGSEGGKTGRGGLPKGLWRHSVDRGLMFVGGSTSDGGSALDWALSLGDQGDMASYERDAAAMAPDSHGLTILPFFSGESNSSYRENSGAVIAGLTLRTNKAALVRAVMEAVSLRVTAILAKMRLRLPRIGLEVCASGSALCPSALWQKILAECLGFPITILPEDDEAICLGAALLAARSYGMRFIHTNSQQGTRIVPSADAVRAMKLALKRQDRLLRALYGEEATDMSD